MRDFCHLDSINLRLSHERSRLDKAKTESEKEIRKVWVAQIEKELENELKFLGIKDVEENEMSGDDLLKELFGE